MNRLRLAALPLLAVVAWSGFSLAAQAPAKPGTPAILDVEYLVEGAYSAKRDMDSTDWRVKRSLKVSYEIYAGELTKVGIGDPGHTAEVEAASEALGAQGEAAAANNADLMANVQAGVDACGDDEACIEKFAMQMAQQPDTKQQLDKMSKDVKGMTGQAAALDAKTPPRFQQWGGRQGQPVKIGGQVGLEESLHATVYDPICHETKNICTSDRKRKGGHAVNASAGELAMASPMVEIDTVKDLISLVLPTPIVVVKVDETTPQGTAKAEVPFLGYPGDLVEELKIVDANGRQGEKTIKLKRLDQDYAQPVTVVIRWHFRAP